MNKRNLLSIDKQPLEARQMLAASNIARFSISIDNGRIVAQDSELNGQGSIRATVNGQEVINQSSNGASSASGARPARSAAPSSRTRADGAARPARTRRAASPARAERGTRSAGRNTNSVATNARSNGNNSAGRNAASVNLSVQNGQIVSQNTNLQGNGSLSVSVNGQQVINETSSGSAPLNAARPARSASRPAAAATQPAAQSQRSATTTSMRGSRASANFVVENGEVVSQDINLQGNASISGNINGQPFSQTSTASAPGAGRPIGLPSR